MYIKLLTIGKTDISYLIDAIAIYESRLKHYINFNIVSIPNLKSLKNLSETQIKEKEGELILASIQKNEDMFLLDDKGKMHTSLEFSEFLSKRMTSFSKDIVFVVGGAYGFSQDVYNKASGKISFSKMTFTHQMIRLLFVEQLYRAFSIIKGESYHHE